MIDRARGRARVASRSGGEGKPIMNAEQQVQCVNCGNMTVSARPCAACWCPDPQRVDFTLAKLMKQKLADAGHRPTIQIKLPVSFAQKLVDQEDTRLGFIRMIAGLTTTEGRLSANTVYVLIRTARKLLQGATMSDAWLEEAKQ